MSGRTPGPWQVAGTSGALAIEASPHGMLAAIRYLGSAREAEELANATFIVEACNAHDRLVAQRNALASVVHGFLLHDGLEIAKPNGPHRKLYDMAVAALTLKENTCS